MSRTRQIADHRATSFLIKEFKAQRREIDALEAQQERLRESLRTPEEKIEEKVAWSDALWGPNGVLP